MRRKVIFFSTMYRDDDEPRKILQGELTSWTRGRGYRSVQGVVVMGQRSRENMDPDDIYEDTPENRAAMERVIEFDRTILKADKAAKKVIEKEIKRAAMPVHFTEGADQ